MADFVVHSPVEDFTGEACGVDFKDGVAEISTPGQIAAYGYFCSAGYKVEKKTARAKAATKASEDKGD